MSGEKIKLEGLGRLNRQLRELEGKLDVEVAAINRKVATFVMWAALRFVPVKKGKLAGTIHTRSTKTTASVVAGGAAVPYAAPIHWGWHRHHIKAQKFMYQALDASYGEVVATYEHDLRLLVERAFPAGGVD